MRVEFLRAVAPGPDAQPEAEPPQVGWAAWEAGVVRVEAEDDEDRAAIARLFRRTPVTLDDSSLRQRGTFGPVTFPPGSLRWFRAAATSRAPAEGLIARFVPDRIAAMGWDPAGAYRRFTDAMERQESVGASRRTEPPSPDR